MDRGEVIKTISIISLMFLVCYLIFNLKVFLLIAVLLCILNSFENRIAFYIAKTWMGFVSILGKINSKIILFLFFYLLFAPFSFIYRIFNAKLVRHFKNNQRDSLFDDVNVEYKKEDFGKIW